MITSWSLFLDDERFPPLTEPQDWIIARTMDEAVRHITIMGLPYRMSLDHDLGDGIPTGQDFVHWLVNQDLDKHFDISMITSFYVHSQNPIGARNMNELFESYKLYVKE